MSDFFRAAQELSGCFGPSAPPEVVEGVVTASHGGSVDVEVRGATYHRMPVAGQSQASPGDRGPVGLLQPNSQRGPVWLGSATKGHRRARSRVRNLELAWGRFRQDARCDGATGDTEIRTLAVESAPWVMWGWYALLPRAADGRVFMVGYAPKADYKEWDDIQPVIGDFPTWSGVLSILEAVADGDEWEYSDGTPLEDSPGDEDYSVSHFQVEQQGASGQVAYLGWEA